MTMLRNLRHERFARLLANGYSKSQAYHLAGYKYDPGNAVRLTKNDKVRKRVDQIMRDSSKLSAQDILDHVLAVYDLAIETEQCGAALKSMELLGKERGLFRDRREILNVNLDALSLNETEQYLIDKYGDRATELINWIKQSRVSSKGSNTVDAETARGGAARLTQPPYLALVTSSSA